MKSRAPRLVDANKLLQDIQDRLRVEEDKYTKSTGYVYLAEGKPLMQAYHDICVDAVNNAQEVDSIPVEWINDRIYDMKRAPLYRRYAEMLLMEWLQEQKEQEAGE